MSSTPLPLAELLAECDAHGIRLLLADDGGLTIDAPQDALTPDLLDRLKAHKDDLMALVRARLGNAPEAVPTPAAQEKLVTPICRCGGTTWRDVPIHEGQSVRRDCGRCGRFIEFSIWYGITTLHNEQ